MFDVRGFCFCFALLAWLIAAAPAFAQVSPYVTVLRSSLVPISFWTDPEIDPVVRADGDCLATLARARDGTNVELEVPFQTAVLTRLLRQVQGDTAIVRANWLYTDGTEGTAAVGVER